MKSNLCILGVVWAVLITVGASGVSAQEVQFNYNGRVKVGSEMYNGQGLFKFALVSKDGENTYWTNDGVTTSTAMPSGTVEVPVADGFFTVDIGDTELSGMAVLTRDVFVRDETMYLRVWFSDGAHGFELLSPDRKITNKDLLGLKVSKVKDYTIYVNDATGSDKNVGVTPSKPKRTIQSAVDSLPARLECNVTIDIADGTYREQVNIVGINVVPGKKLTLLGDDSWTTITAGDPTVRITGKDDDGAATSVRDKGIYAVNCSGLHLEGLLVVDCSQYGVRLESCSTSEVARCKFTGCVMPDVSGCGFFAMGGTQIAVTNCIATQNDTGLVGYSSKIMFTSVTANANNRGGFSITDCVAGIVDCKGNLNGNNPSYSFGLQAKSHTEVNFFGNNEFSDNTVFGMHIAGVAFITFDENGNTTIARNKCGMQLDLYSFAYGTRVCTFSGNTTDYTTYRQSNNFPNL
jgi:hypothetical protein